MQTKSIETENNCLKPSPLDLFGDVIVTHSEIFEWVHVITYGKFSGKLLDWYVKNYNFIPMTPTLRG